MREAWIAFAELEALVTTAATGYVILQSKKHRDETILLVPGFSVLAVRSLFHLLTPPEGIYRILRGFWVPVVDQMLLTLFFVLIAYALLYPLFPVYRQPVKWILWDNTFLTLSLSAVIGYDYYLNWHPREKFVEHWGSAVFKVYQLSMLLLILALTLYVYRKGKSRAILLTITAFLIWATSSSVGLWTAIKSSAPPPGWGYLIRSADLIALLLLAGSNTFQASAKKSFAQRYFSDARSTVRELELQLMEATAAKASLEERQRLSRELHDSVTQELFGLELTLSTAAALMERDPEHALHLLKRARRTVHEALGELRALIAGLRPPALAGKSIIEALQDFAKSLEMTGTKVRVEGEVRHPLSPSEESELYRIAYEAINNAAKHANPSLISVSLWIDSPRFKLTISDDGHGFDPTQQKEGAWGLPGMRERADRIGASFKIESSHGSGTKITVER